MLLSDAKKRARNHAADVSIRIAGITRDYSIVTGKDCVQYQEKQNNLLAKYEGNWYYHKTRRTSGWKKGRTIISWYWYKCPDCDVVLKHYQHLDTERYGNLDYYHCPKCKERYVTRNNGELATPAP